MRSGDKAALLCLKYDVSLSHYAKRHCYVLSHIYLECTMDVHLRAETAEK